MEQFKQRKVYEEVREDVCWAVTGKAPTGNIWIGINKGDESNPYYRSRLVAPRIKYNSKEKHIFAATPPLEALRLILSHAATWTKEKGGERRAVMINDVRRAYFYANVPEICTLNCQQRIPRRPRTS